MSTSSPERCRVVGAPVSYGVGIFKDRRRQLEQILGWLADPATRMVTVFGRRGIGKSALAAKVVDTLAADGACRGIVNLSTRSEGAARSKGTISIELIFFTCAEVAEPAERDALDTLWASQRDRRDKLFRLFEMLGDRLNLIVLDNIEDQLKDTGEPVGHDLEIFLDVIFRLPNGPRLLITSQVPIALDPAVRPMQARLHLRDGLPVPDSVALLRELDRDGEAGLLNATDAELANAARSLHGLPRALQLAVSTMNADDLTLPTFDDVLKDFTSQVDIVDQLAQGRYKRLESEARLVLDVLAVFRSPVRREPVQWVIASLAPHIDVAKALSNLNHVYMVSVDRYTKQFALHPTDADLVYAALPAAGPFSRQVLERRVAAWYEHTRKLPPWDSIADVANQRTAFEHRLHAGDYNACAFILDDISEFLALQGSGRAVAGMHFALEGRLTDDAPILADLVSFGIARHLGGPYQDAIAPLRRAVQLADRLGDLPHLARALFSLGDILRYLRQLPEAVELLGRAAEVAGQLGDVEHQAHSMLCLSLSHSYLGQLAEALAVADRITELAEQSGMPIVAGRAGDAHSLASVIAGRWEDAYQAGDAALRAYQEAGVPEALGYARNVQGIALIAMGRVADAIAYLEQARNYSVGAESPRAEGLCSFNLAWSYWLSGDYGAAEDAAQHAVQAFRRAGEEDIDASQHLAAAMAAMRAGDKAAARAALTAVAEAARGNSDLVPTSWVLDAVARLGAGTGQAMETSGQPAGPGPGMAAQPGGAPLEDA